MPAPKVTMALTGAGESLRANRTQFVGSINAAFEQQQTEIDQLSEMAFESGDVYPSTSAGLADTTLGQQFRVASSDPDIAFLVYRHDAGPVATLIATTPSVAALADKASVDALFGEALARIAGDDALREEKVDREYLDVIKTAPGLWDDFTDRRQPLNATGLARPLRAGRWNRWHNTGNWRLRPEGGAELAVTEEGRRYARSGAVFRDYLAVLTIQPSAECDFGWVIRSPDSETGANPRLYVRCFAQPSPATAHVKIWYATTGTTESQGVELAEWTGWQFQAHRQFDLGIRVEGRHIRIYIDGRSVIDHTITVEQDAALEHNFGLTARLGAGAGVTQPGVARRVAVWPLASRPADYPLVIAHRGVSRAPYTHSTLGWQGVEPENCLSMVERLPHGVGIEIDSRETSDGVPVLMHDTTVNRTTDGTGTVAGMTAAQITSLTVRGLGGQRVGTIAELLAALEYRPDIPEILIHYNAGSIATLLDVIHAAPAEVQARCVFFCAYEHVSAVRALDPTIRMAVGSRTVGNAGQLPALESDGVEILLTPPNADSEQLAYLATLKAAGFRAFASTVQWHWHARQIHQLGADGFLCDYPESMIWGEIRSTGGGGGGAGASVDPDAILEAAGGARQSDLEAEQGARIAGDNALQSAVDNMLLSTGRMFPTPADGYASGTVAVGEAFMSFASGILTLFRKDSSSTGTNLGRVFTTALFPAGTAAAPGAAVEGDTDTGLFAPAANVLGFAAGGTERLRFSGNSIVTPEASRLTGGAVAQQEDSTSGRLVTTQHRVFRGLVSGFMTTGEATTADTRILLGSSDSLSEAQRGVVIGSLGSTVSATTSGIYSCENAQVSAPRSAALASWHSLVGGPRNLVAASLNSVANNATGQCAVIAGRMTVNDVANSLALGYSAGTGLENASTANRKIHLYGQTGNVEIAGTLSSSHSFADFAEMFPNAASGEIPVGTIVTETGGRVRPAGAGDEIAGVVSATAVIVAGDTPFAWQGRYLADDWGRLTVTEILDPDWEPLVEDPAWQPVLGEDGEALPDQTPPLVANPVPQAMISVQVENPAWDPTAPQIPRSQRPEEWSCVGLLGQVFVRVAEGVQPGDRLAAEGGIGVPSAARTGLRCMAITRPYDAAEGYAIARCLINVRV